MIFGETLLPGRVANQESHAYDIYWAETEARRGDGTLLFADVLRLDGGDPKSLASIGLLGPYDVLAALYVISDSKDPADLIATLPEALSASFDVLAGVSELPKRCGV